MWSVTDSKCTLFMRDAQLSLTASICARSHSSAEIPFNCSHFTQVKRLPNLHLAVQAAHAVQTSATQATPQRARTATSTPTTKDVHTAAHADFLASLENDGFCTRASVRRVGQKHHPFCRWCTSHRRLYIRLLGELHVMHALHAYIYYVACFKHRPLKRPLLMPRFICRFCYDFHTRCTHKSRRL